MKKTLMHTREEKEGGNNSSLRGNQAISGVVENLQGGVENIVSEEIKEVTNFNNKQFVETRLIFLRHLPYKETPDYTRYNEILKKKINGEIITTSEISELGDLTGKLEVLKYSELKDNSREKRIYDEAISDPENTLLIFNEDRDINPNISRNGTELANIGGGKLENIIVRMPKTDKQKGFGENMVIVSRSFDEIYEIINSEIKKGKYKKIVFLGNRSYAHEFDLKILGNRKSSVATSIKHFEEKGYFIADYDDKGKLVEGDGLVVTPDNYEEILLEVSEIIPQENKNITQLELQNYLNDKLEEDCELSKRYLYSKNTDLMIYCLGRLCVKRNKQFDIDSFLNSRPLKKESLKNILKILINQQTSGLNDISHLRVIVGVKIKLIENINLNSTFNLPKNEEEEIDEIISGIYNIRQITENNIFNIFDKSLDENIRKGKGIINRQKYRFVEITKKEQKMQVQNKDPESTSENIDYKKIYKEEIISFEDILNDLNRLVHIINADVGEGKSIELANLAKTINESDCYSSKFECILITAKDINNYNSENIDELIKCYNDLIIYSEYKKIIIIIDGFDEIQDELKEKVGSLLNFTRESTKYLYGNQKTSTLIIGTRKGEFQDSKDNSNMYYFKKLTEFEVNDFIKTRLISLTKKNTSQDKLNAKIEEINAFIKNGIIDDEIKSTPLILFLICELSTNNILKEVSNRAVLYELVVSGIMEKHKKNSGITIEHNLDDLGIIAFNQYVIGNKIKVKLNGLNLISKLSKKDILRYDVLFQNPGSENPIFIHNSFYEYFLARYIAKNPGLEKYIYQYRDNKKTNWNNWRGFRPVIQFFGEELINNQEFNKLEDFLGKNGILKNDDIYGEGFFNGLEILIKLEGKYGNNDTLLRIKALYLDKIWKFTKEDIINKINGFIEFQERIGYKENEHVDMFLEKIKINYNELCNYNDKRNIIHRLKRNNIYTKINQFVSKIDSRKNELVSLFVEKKLETEETKKPERRLGYYEIGESLINELVGGNIELKGEIIDRIEKWRENNTMYGNDFIYKYLLNFYKAGDIYTEQLLLEFIKHRIYFGELDDKILKYPWEDECITPGYKMKDILVSLIKKGELKNNKILGYIINLLKKYIGHEILTEIYVTLAKNGNKDSCYSLEKYLNYVNKFGESTILSKVHTRIMKFLQNEIMINKNDEEYINIFKIWYKYYFNDPMNCSANINQILKLAPESIKIEIYTNLDHLINNKKLSKSFIFSIFETIKDFNDEELVLLIKKNINTIFNNPYRVVDSQAINNGKPFENNENFMISDENLVVEIVSKNNNEYNEVIYKKTIECINNGKIKLTYGLEVLLMLVSKGKNESAIKYLLQNSIELHNNNPEILIFGRIFIELAQYCPQRNIDDFISFRNKIAECINILLQNYRHSDCLKLIKIVILRNIKGVTINPQCIIRIINMLGTHEHFKTITEFKTLNIKIPEHRKTEEDIEILLS